MADQDDQDDQDAWLKFIDTLQYKAWEQVGGVLGFQLGAITGFLLGVGIGYGISSLIEGIADKTIDNWTFALVAGLEQALVGGYLLSKTLGKALGKAMMIFIMILTS